MRGPWMLLLAGAIACERTPHEDFAPRPSSPVVTSTPPPTAQVRTAGAMGLEGRCILPTPAEPPAAAPRGPAPGCPPDPESPAGAPVVARVAFPEAAGATVKAEIVRSQHDTARGLMYRTSLAEDSGMLFDLRVRGDHKFWMHNTCIPLDLLYIDEDGLIVGIVESAPTLNDDSRGVDCPSLYVLEVNAGWARRHGVKAGQRLDLPAEVRERSARNVLAGGDAYP